MRDFPPKKRSSHVADILTISVIITRNRNLLIRPIILKNAENPAKSCQILPHRDSAVLRELFALKRIVGSGVDPVERSRRSLLRARESSKKWSLRGAFCFSLLLASTWVYNSDCRSFAILTLSSCCNSRHVQAIARFLAVDSESTRNSLVLPLKNDDRPYRRANPPRGWCSRAPSESAGLGRQLVG